jgi:hypothetical protein
VTDVSGGIEKAVWDTAAIDAYLMRLAQAVQGRLSKQWDALKAAGERQSAYDAQHAEAWRHILGAKPEQIEAALLRQDQPARTLRAVFPFCAVLSRETRDEELRASALASPVGAAYAPRWKDAPPAGGFVDMIVEHVLSAFDYGQPSLYQNFAEFVAASGQTKWLLSADFCLHDDTRPNDVFAFTVFPYDADFEAINAEIMAVFPRDAKSTRDITPDMIAFLRSHRRFHFAFVVNRDRLFLPDVESARQAIDVTIDIMSRYKDVEDQRDAIARLRALRQEANANSFNYLLAQDMILMAAFGGIIALLLELEGRAEHVAFFPDRDDMTTAYKAIAYFLMAHNASSFALRRKVPEAQMALALPGPRDDGRRGIYADELVRIPDYIAAAVSGTELAQLNPASVSQKAADLVGKAFVDSSNISIMRVDLSPLALAARRIMIQSTPPAAQGGN